MSGYYFISSVIQITILSLNSFISSVLPITILLNFFSWIRLNQQLKGLFLIHSPLIVF